MISYRALSPISISELLGCKKFAKFGVRVVYEKGDYYLSDGLNRLNVDGCADGFVTEFSSSYRDRPFYMLAMISDFFDVEVCSECDPKFWGFETEEELESWHRERIKADEDEFYDDIIKFVRGETNGLIEGTGGYKDAELAKQLILLDPSLALPEMRDVLFAKIDPVDW